MLKCLAIVDLIEAVKGRKSGEIQVQTQIQVQMERSDIPYRAIASVGTQTQRQRHRQNQMERSEGMSFPCLLTFNNRKVGE
jgi:hypothetical protein